MPNAEYSWGGGGYRHSFHTEKSGNIFIIGCNFELIWSNFILKMHSVNTQHSDRM